MLKEIPLATAGHLQTDAIDPYILKVRAQWRGIFAPRGIATVRDYQQHAIFVSADALQVSGCKRDAVKECRA